MFLVNSRCVFIEVIVVVVFLLTMFLLKGGNVCYADSGKSQASSFVASVAVWKDNVQPLGVKSDPDYLGALLEEAGYKVVYVSTKSFDSIVSQQQKNYDLVVLPYGGAFPTDQEETLLSYLKSGGRLFVTGGYAFDGSKKGMNTRHGEAQDWLSVDLIKQIPIFDAGHELRFVSRAQANHDQRIISPDIRLDVPLEGYSAVAMVGNNQAVYASVYGRWIPLVFAYDDNNRIRGTVGAMTHFFGGPLAGSSIAFFGVTNQDLFSEQLPSMSKAFVQVVDSLVESAYIRELQTDYATYRQGEPVEVSVILVTNGLTPRDLGIKVQIIEEANRKIVYENRVDISAPLLGISPVSVRWESPEFETDFYKVTAYVMDGDREIDAFHSGFVVWDPASGMPGKTYTYNNNYIEVDGSPRLQFSAKMPGSVFYSSLENPLVWLHDIQLMKDGGLDEYEIIHLSPMVADLSNPKEEILRKLDAIIYLLQREGMSKKIGLFDWTKVVADEHVIMTQIKWAQTVASRYKNVPGIKYDLQGDIPNLDENASLLKKLWNEFLSNQYGSDKGLKAAWSLENLKEKLGDVEYEQPKRVWGNKRFVDVEKFKNTLFAAWSGRLVAAIKEIDPIAPITAEFIPPNMVGTNPHLADLTLRMAATNLDYATIGYFWPVNDFARMMKFTDMRVSGQSLGINEFGVKTHPAWNKQGGVSIEESIRYYLDVSHLSFGLGASVVLSWQLKDPLECIFPWGMIHHGDSVPKDVFYAYRAASLLFHGIEPVYMSPEVLLVVPTNHYSSSALLEVKESLFRSIESLLGSHVQFGVVDEDDLDRVDVARTKLLIYPLAYGVSDSVYDELVRLVSSGVNLYMSGDIGYDENFQRTGNGRYEELVGVRFVRENYKPLQPSNSSRTPIRAVHNTELPSWQGYPQVEVRLSSARVLADDNKRRPVIVQNQFGRGKVYYCTDIPEYHFGPGSAGNYLWLAGDTLTALYAWFARESGVAPAPISKDLEQIHYMEINGRDSSILVFAPRSTFNIGNRFDMSIALDNDLELGVMPGWPSVLELTHNGYVKSVEVWGDLEIKGKGGDSVKIISAEGGAIVIALDDKDLRESRQLMIIPIRTGEISFNMLLSSMDWANPVLQKGDIIDGRWTAFDTRALQASDSRCDIVVEPLDALSTIYILANGDELDSAVGALLERR